MPALVTLQVAPVAHELACYPDDAAYYAAQEQAPRFAAESLIPSGLFAPAGRGRAGGSVVCGPLQEQQLADEAARFGTFYGAAARLSVEVGE